MEKILVGYYSGAYIRPLTTDIRIERPARETALTEVFDWLVRSPRIFVTGGTDNVKHSDAQVSVDAKFLIDPDSFRGVFDQRFGTAGLVQLSRSGHSFDISLTTTCKTDVVKAVRNSLGNREAAILCVGDSGAAGGNDHKLLGTPYGISVGQVCDRLHTCWSLFGEATVGPDALVRILRALKPNREGRIQLELRGL